MQSHRLATTTATPPLLRAAAAFFVVAVLLHNADHLRRGGDAVSADVFWLGSAAILIEVGVVLLVFMGHPAAPVVAAATGFSLALGYLGVHFTPERGWLSDSFVSGGAGGLSWTAASLETVAALALGVAGVMALRQQDGPAVRADADTLSVADALRHPLVAAMALGNAIIFVGSLVTR